jgi:hypothetical protein
MSSTFVNIKVNEKCESSKYLWNKVLSDAQGQLGDAKLRLARLRAAISYFKQQIRSGADFPTPEFIMEHWNIVSSAQEMAERDREQSSTQNQSTTPRRLSLTL